MSIRYKFRELKELIIYHLNYIFTLFNKRISIVELFKQGMDYTLDGSIRLKYYLVKSNMWGSFKIPDKYENKYGQFINKSGWIFETPRRNYGVIGYPSITYHNEGIKISDIETYTVSYNSTLDVEKYKKINTSFDFWINKENTFGFPTTVQEIMIWDYYFVSKPFGKYMGDVNLNNQKYRLYVGYIDKSVENLGVDGWNYICFLKVDRVTKNTLDIKYVLDYLSENLLISKNDYLVRSEFGNEIYNASGKFNINEFSYHLNNNGVNVIY